MGGVLQPEEHCTKMVVRVMVLLRTKHPNAHSPSAATLDTYTGQPIYLVPVDITENTVMEIEGSLSKGAGTGRRDLVSLQH